MHLKANEGSSAEYLCHMNLPAESVGGASAKNRSTGDFTDVVSRIIQYSSFTSRDGFMNFCFTKFLHFEIKEENYLQFRNLEIMRRFFLLSRANWFKSVKIIQWTPLNWDTSGYPQNKTVPVSGHPL